MVKIAQDLEYFRTLDDNWYNDRSIFPYHCCSVVKKDKINKWTKKILGLYASPGQKVSYWCKNILYLMCKERNKFLKQKSLLRVGTN